MDFAAAVTARRIVRRAGAEAMTLGKVLYLTKKSLKRGISRGEEIMIEKEVDNLVYVQLLQASEPTICDDTITPEDTYEVALGYCSRIDDPATSSQVKAWFLRALTDLPFTSKSYEDAGVRETLEKASEGDDVIVSEMSKSLLYFFERLILDEANGNL
jgi:hypothetical protein